VTFHEQYFRIFILNLSAPFIVQVFGAQLPRIDHPIGNEAESEAWASANGLPDPNGFSAVTKTHSRSCLRIYRWCNYRFLLQQSC